MEFEEAVMKLESEPDLAECAVYIGLVKKA